MKADAKRVNTSQTRRAKIKLDQEECLLTVDCEAVRPDAMTRTDKEERLKTSKREIEKQRKVNLKLIQYSHAMLLWQGQKVS